MFVVEISAEISSIILEAATTQALHLHWWDNKDKR
jgi:hypothetical protein